VRRAVRCAVEPLAGFLAMFDPLALHTGSKTFAVGTRGMRKLEWPRFSMTVFDPKQPVETTESRSSIVKTSRPTRVSWLAKDTEFRTPP